MQAYVYADLFVLINTVVNCLLLWAAGVLAGLPRRPWRVLLGGFLGGLYSLVLFLPSVPVLTGGGGKLVISLLMLVAAFWPVRKGQFLHLVGYFYFASFFLAGTALGIYYLSQQASLAGGYLRYGQGVSAWSLGAAVGISLVLGKVVWDGWRQRRWEELFFTPLEIFFGDRVVRVRALLDTGNCLREPLSGLPVVVVEYPALSPVLPVSIRGMFEAGGGDVMALASLPEAPAPWLARIRLLPYRTIGKGHGILVGFRADRILLREGGRLLEAAGAVVAVHGETFCRNGEGAYQALLPPDVCRAARPVTGEARTGEMMV